MLPLQRGEFLLIPSIYLVKGENNIAICYISTFNTDGLGSLGPYSFFDIRFFGYNYTTMLRPCGARRFIPCFDQPDLKAKVIFSIITADLDLNPETVKSNEVRTFFDAYSRQTYLDNVPCKN